LVTKPYFAKATEFAMALANLNTSFNERVDNWGAGVFEYFEVCGKDKGKNPGREYCINDFRGMGITHNVSGNGRERVRVGRMQANGLAQELALRRNGHSILCDPQTRVSSNRSEDFLKCTSTDGRHFYEFQFDSLNATMDHRITDGIIEGICNRIHGIRFFPGTSELNYCETNQSTCEGTLRTSFERFGFTTAMQSNTNRCIVRDIVGPGGDAVRTAYGINNRIFETIQVRASSDTPNIIRRYAEVQLNNSGRTLAEFRCNDSWAGSSLFSGKNILTCHLRIVGEPAEKPIDFVFDNLSPMTAYTDRGGVSGMSCIDAGGDYDGRNCWITQSTCSKMNDSMRARGGRGTEWKSELRACVLLDAQHADRTNRLIRTGVMVGVTAVSCAAAVGSAGGAAHACILAAVEIAGVIGESITEAAISNWSNQFFAESRNCQTGNCAEGVLRAQLARVLYAANKGYLNGARENMVYNEIERLINLLPIAIQNTIFTDPNANAWDEAAAYFNSRLTAADRAIMVANTASFTIQFASFAASIPGLKRIPEAFRNFKQRLKGPQGFGALADNVAQTINQASGIAGLADRK